MIEGEDVDTLPVVKATLLIMDAFQGRRMNASRSSPALSARYLKNPLNFLVTCRKETRTENIHCRKDEMCRVIYLYTVGTPSLVPVV